MDAYLTAQILKSLTEGNIPEFLAYVAIFVFIWIEVRGMKNQLVKLNQTVTNSFAEGEVRFDQLEDGQKDHEHRVTVVETAIAQLTTKVNILEFQTKPKEG